MKGPSSWSIGMECLDVFASIYFNERERLTRAYNVVITSIFNMSTPAANIQNGYLKFINEIISQRTKHEVYQLRIMSDSQPYHKGHMGNRALLLADFYILVTDNFDTLKNLMKNYITQASSWNPSARFLLLYNNPIDYDSYLNITEKLFRFMLYECNAYRVAMLFATGPTKYTFSVLDYYNKIKCQSMQIRHIGYCQNGKAHPSFNIVSTVFNVFLNGISLKNCTFRMCASISAPFVEADCITGIELRLVAFIKNRLNFEIVQTCEEVARGENKNGTWTGLLSKLTARKCDFILGGFYPDNDVSESFWFTDTYLADSHTWFVKLSEVRPPWKALYKIFNKYTWVCFGLVLLIIWCFWYIFVNMMPEPKAHKELSLAGLNSMAVSICAAVNERPLCNTPRIFFFTVALYGLNVCAIYTSLLVSVLTDPGYLHQIDELNEVVEHGIPFGGIEENSDWFENEDDMWIHDQFNSSELFLPTSENLKAVQRGERVILSSRMFIMQNKIADEIYAFPQNVFNSPLQMIVMPGFPLLSHFNYMIRAMSDNGIFSKIDMDFRYNNSYLNRIAKMRPKFKESTIVLTTAHVQGPFGILIIGLSCSSLLFIGENFLYYTLGPYLRKHYDWNIGKKATKINTKKEKMNNGLKRIVTMKPQRYDKVNKKEKSQLENNIKTIKRSGPIKSIEFIVPHQWLEGTNKSKKVKPIKKQQFVKNIYNNNPTIPVPLRTPNIITFSIPSDPIKPKQQVQFIGLIKNLKAAERYDSPSTFKRSKRQIKPRSANLVYHAKPVKINRSHPKLHLSTNLLKLFSYHLKSSQINNIKEFKIASLRNMRNLQLTPIFYKKNVFK
ncbi:uncharacterized protein LOC119678287 [Teleopsis dalmanni]|uniref:uncharacterized protein LOC119678287 n=1 Tax=Teleopsis dalmanni TaxID=139649 RepID=UPI0018CD2FE3|nr:uncharacterized protein LOC119678287 [Teleopsis dalmanni]